MGVYTRPDSRYYWMSIRRLGEGRQRCATPILIDAATEAERQAQRLCAERFYSKMNELAMGIPTPVEPPPADDADPLIHETVTLNRALVWEAKEVTGITGLSNLLRTALKTLVTDAERRREHWLRNLLEDEDEPEHDLPFE